MGTAKRKVELTHDGCHIICSPHCASYSLPPSPPPNSPPPSPTGESTLRRPSAALPPSQRLKSPASLTAPKPSPPLTCRSVYFEKAKRRWRSNITRVGAKRSQNLGTFKSAEAAALAYDVAARELFVS